MRDKKVMLPIIYFKITQQKKKKAVEITRAEVNTARC